MSKRNINLYLDDIKDSIKKIEDFTNSLSFQKFRKADLIIDAVVRNMEIIGEAAKNIPDSVKEKNENIPWNEISGMRNRIIHEYFNVDLEILWKAVQEDIPELKKQINKIKI